MSKTERFGYPDYRMLFQDDDELRHILATTQSCLEMLAVEERSLRRWYKANDNNYTCNLCEPKHNPSLHALLNILFDRGCLDLDISDDPLPETPVYVVWDHFSWSQSLRWYQRSLDPTDPLGRLNLDVVTPERKSAVETQVREWYEYQHTDHDLPTIREYHRGYEMKRVNPVGPEELTPTPDYEPDIPGLGCPDYWPVHPSMSAYVGDHGCHGPNICFDYLPDAERQKWGDYIALETPKDVGRYAKVIECEDMDEGEIEAMTKPPIEGIRNPSIDDLIAILRKNGQVMILRERLDK